MSEIFVAPRRNAGGRQPNIVAIAFCAAGRVRCAADAADRSTRFCCRLHGGWSRAHAVAARRQQWERGIVLRLGRFHGMYGPGLFFVMPFVDSVSNWIDQRTITTSFAAEQTLTSDTVPVNVDAVLFWMVHDAQKAALEVQDHSQAVSWAAQTALRDIIGARRSPTCCADVNASRPSCSNRSIGARIRGVTVSSVEMRDVVIPSALQDAMSRSSGRTRETGAHHPRRSGTRNRRVARPRVAVMPRTIRPHCTCAP